MTKLLIHASILLLILISLVLLFEGVGAIIGFIIIFAGLTIMNVRSLK